MSRIYDPDPDPLSLYPGKLPTDIDPPVKPPDHMPSATPPTAQERYASTPIYDELTYARLMNGRLVYTD